MPINGTCRMLKILHSPVSPTALHVICYLADEVYVLGAPDFSASNPPQSDESSDSSASSTASLTSLSRNPGTSTSPPPRATTDHFIQNSVQPTPSAQPLAQSQITTVSSSSSASVFATPTNVDKNASNAASATKRRAPIAAIVGGTIGGFFGLLLACMALLVYRYLRTPRAVHARKGSLSSNETGHGSFGNDEKYLDPPNSAGLPASPLSIYVSVQHAAVFCICIDQGDIPYDF